MHVDSDRIPLFCDTVLAERVERVEAQLMAEASRAARRRRGIQTALLAARLTDAAAAGCYVAVVTTQPGSKSQQNVQRRGFDLLYTRAILIKRHQPAAT